jgi:hypothetical protein
VAAGAVPTAGYKAGNLTYYTPNGDGTDSTYTLTPADIQRMDPQGIGENTPLLALLQTYPGANDGTQGDQINSSGYRFEYTLHRKYDTYIARLDWDVTKNGKHTLFWRGNLQGDNEPSPPAFPGQPPATSTLTNSRGYAAGYTWLIS